MPFVKLFANISTSMIIFSIVACVFFFLVLPWLIKKYKKATVLIGEINAELNNDNNAYIVTDPDEMRYLFLNNKISAANNGRTDEQIFRIKEIFYDSLEKTKFKIFAVMARPAAMFRGREVLSKTVSLNTLYTGSESVKDAAEEFEFEAIDSGGKIALLDVSIFTTTRRTDDPADPLIEVMDTDFITKRKIHGQVLNIFKVRYAKL